MGYMNIEKIHEDEHYIIYSYSRDGGISDGIIKIKKTFCDLENINEWYCNNVELTPSSTDIKNVFAMKAIVFIAKIFNKDTWDFPDKYMFAFG